MRGLVGTEGALWVSSAPPFHRDPRSERGEDDVWGLRFIIPKDEPRFIFYIIRGGGAGLANLRSPNSAAI